MNHQSDMLPSRCIDLPSCVLHPLEKGEALGISRTLASMEPWRTLRSSPEGLCSYLLRTDPALQRYAVKVSDEVAGVFCVRHPWLLGPYVELFAIYQPYQGTGLGREILKWLEDQSREGSRNIWATVSSFNDKARRFYRSMGFEEVTVIKGLVKQGCDEVLLRRQLDTRK